MPSLIPLLHTHHQPGSPEQAAPGHDPVTIGFGDFAEAPRAEREAAVREVYAGDVRDAGYTETGERYLGAVAAAAVDTAASTGLSYITLPLLYRAAKRHYDYEMGLRFQAEATLLEEDFDTLTQTLSKREQRALRHELNETGPLDEQQGDYFLRNRGQDNKFGRSLIVTRISRPTSAAERDLPGTKLFAEGFDLSKGKPVSALEVATRGLRIMRRSLRIETILLNNTRQAITERFPLFPTVVVEQAAKRFQARQSS
ncbi:MAG TPA: hypothetical protein VD735_01660 [Candidatus Saccharimonadales bacterium]|nr:hypothetical protein [Candidatus Saccharimonadales bacterium]